MLNTELLLDSMGNNDVNLIRFANKQSDATATAAASMDSYASQHRSPLEVESLENFSGCILDILSLEPIICYIVTTQESFWKDDV